MSPKPTWGPSALIKSAVSAFYGNLTERTVVHSKLRSTAKPNWVVAKKSFGHESFRLTLTAAGYDDCAALHESAGANGLTKAQRADMSAARSIAIWVLQILTSLPFFAASVTKLLSTPGWVTRFRVYGYPEHFYLFIGAVELLGAVGLLIPRTSPYAAGGLIVVMMGAATTHLLHSEAPRVIVNAILILLLAAVAYSRKPQFAAREADTLK